MKPLSLTLFCLATACGSNSTNPAPAPAETNESEVAPESQGETAEGSPATCEAAADCGACMDVAGCSWTPDGCSASCLMDTWCITPGNECPAVPEGLVGSWQEDQSRRSGTSRVFVSAEQDLGPTRFRQTYTFRADGTADIGVLAPNDAHYSATGTWSLAPGAEVSVAYETQEGESRVESWTAEMSEGTLTLSPVPAPNW